MDLTDVLQTFGLLQDFIFVVQFRIKNSGSPWNIKQNFRELVQSSTSCLIDEHTGFGQADLSTVSKRAIVVKSEVFFKLGVVLIGRF